MARLFFALWPGEPAGRDVGEVAKALAEVAGGRPLAPARIHCTLAFLGEVPEVHEPAIRRAADLVRGASFEFAMDRVGSFARAKVAWVAPASVPPALAELQSRLSANLTRSGMNLETRPFAPHATLVRGIEAAPRPRAIAPVTWPVRGFSLVQTQVGKGRYLRLGEWPLED